MTQPVWETILVDSTGTLITGAVSALVVWLLHRTGRLAPFYARFAVWLTAHGGTIEVDAEKVIEALIRAGARRGVTPTVVIRPPAVPAVQPGGGGGTVSTSGGSGGAGGVGRAVPDGPGPGPAAEPGSPRG